MIGEAKAEVTLYAEFRQFADFGRLTPSVPESGRRLSDILRDAGIPVKEVGVCMKGKTPVKLDDLIFAGDHISVFPLVGGG